jgi:hypothetical protein
MTIITAIISFLLSPVGRWVGIAGVSLALIGGTYTKGYFDGRAAYKTKIEKQIKDAVDQGNAGRRRALDELDAGRLPNDWQRD